MAKQTSQGTLQPREGPEVGRQQNRVIPAYSAEAASAAKAGSGGRCPTASLGMTRKGSRLGVGNRCFQREALRIFSWLKCYAAELF